MAKCDTCAKIVSAGKSTNRAAKRSYEGNTAVKVVVGVGVLAASAYVVSYAVGRGLASGGSTQGTVQKYASPSFRKNTNGAITVTSSGRGFLTPY